jgi:carbon monoxide dehydrogenase subunit G
MEFDNSFIVPLPPARAWAILMDIERIAPCMPGAELTEKVDDRTYKGKVGVRLGPVALAFAGTARFEEIDAANHTARVKAGGMDAKGRGGANAVAGFRIEAAEDHSKVLVHTNLTLSGSVAQYGRGVGMIQDISAELIRQFAGNLRGMIEAEAASSLPPPADLPAAVPTPDAAQPVAQPAPATARAPAPAVPPAARPISGFALILRVLWGKIRRLFTSGSSTA